MCTTCVPGAHRSQKVLNPLRLKLQSVVNHHVDAKCQPGSSAKATSTINH